MNTLNRRPGFEYMDFDDFEELLLDKPDGEKWELIGGRVIRGMVGARWDHNRIVVNITSALLASLRAKGSSCRPFSETFWLKQRFIDLAVFPDVVVQCAPLPSDAVSTDNPVALFEVLSRGSEQRDRVEKWQLYQRLSSLQHYVVVERDSVAIDVFDKVDAGWLARPRLESLGDAVDLHAIGVTVAAREIYRDVIV